MPDKQFPGDSDFEKFIDKAKHDIRGGLHNVDKALDPVHEQLQNAEKQTRKAADEAEKIAKETHIDQIAEAVQTADGIHSVAKGGFKIARTLSNPETRQAVFRAAKDVQELLKDPNALKARLQEELEGFKHLQDAGSEPMHAGERITLQRHGSAAANREANHLTKDVQSMHMAPQSAMRDLPNWDAAESFTVPGKSAVHRQIDAGWKHEFQTMSSQGPSHITVKRLEDVVGRSIDSSPLSASEKMSLKQRLKDELYVERGLQEGDVIRRPYSRGVIHGMRQEDQEVFRKTAAQHESWIAVRATNEESLKYIGKEGYTPKPIECKAKTADMPGHPHAGLVVDPTLHSKAFKDPKAAQEIWKQMGEPLPKGLQVDRNPTSPRYGCLQYGGKYVHADYDLYDIVDPKHKAANLSLVTELGGARHLQTPGLSPIANAINTEIKSPMVQHGGHYQFSKHEDYLVTFFGPQGELFQVEGAKELQVVYENKFPGRRPPNFEIESDPIKRGFERTGPTHVVGREPPRSGPDKPPAPRGPSRGR